MNTEVTIPDIGDAEDVEVIEICVSPGDAVAENDALIVIESEKASMEVPAPFAGKVAEVLVDLADRVNAGDAIMLVETAAADDEAAVSLDADGVGTQDAERSPDSEVVPAAQTAQSPPVATETAPTPPAPSVAPVPATQPAPPAPSASARVYAGPAVRRLARELGVDLAAVSGSGGRGRIVRDDVKSYVKQVLTTGASPNLAPMEDIDFSRFGSIELAPLTRIRARGASNLHRAWQHVVHVTQHEDADVTDLEAFRESLRHEGELRDAKLTPLPFFVKACIHALRQHPQFNASLNGAATTLILKRYYHIGIAVDTEDGLVVPVVRDANRLGLVDLAREVARLSQAARQKRLKPGEIQGGSFTISSLGAIGGTGFTPIVNAPEVAILGIGRMATRPVWDGSAFQPRIIAPLSLSYDHRAINGAEAGRFMADLAKALADIRRLAL